ncbi:hypothetical protein PF007_g23113 [Phytophthora fragariae]|uniref:Uncharacterized protein n=2 Tax=Phytophthora fragariae TaxID=53985 RepID=A0A6A3R6K2_9STRA|nr:hypothetical protein PF003_g15796 [Phytophthora fragariae]KAE8935630.1 hypothetical protein PF009_g14429 [Phytophthora fragariae]KAE8971280.1 hypothetical protein PF011_g26089 [Phytophthora fragariae]KAE9080268.1 hypothetical protein PF007_g23113 [Phytophthora fragariae]KAE9090468.1 hypothetical protein PF006_g25150 [Phytophthora fragariae]
MRPHRMAIHHAAALVENGFAAALEVFPHPEQPAHAILSSTTNAEAKIGGNGVSRGLSAPWADAAKPIRQIHGHESCDCVHPLQPRNLLADIDQTQHDEVSDDSSDSETFDALTPSVDYESWSADQVRKECTRRGLKLKASMKKGERIDVLRRQDVARATYDGILLGDEGESASTNAVTNQSGDMASRAELDSKSVNDRSRFWQEVRAAFVQQYPRTHERNLLLFEDDMFAGADPSVTRSHSASKLLKMSKEVIKNYFIAEQKFTTSGQNEDEFWKFVDKRGAVLYMRKWLTLKPDLINFVKAEKTPSKQKQHKSNEHAEKMVSVVMTYVADRCIELERLSSSTQLQERSQILAILGDIRRQLGEIDREIANATGETAKRLEEDRTILLVERQTWIDKIHCSTTQHNS